MATDLNAPLGTGHRRGPAGPRAPRPGHVLLALGIVAIGGLSAWSMMTPDNIVGDKPVETAATAPDQQKTDDKPGGNPDAPADSAATVNGTDDRTRPLEAANVERTVLEDGTVVTKFTPKKRDKDGPVIIDATANEGQDRRVAALPNPDLLEESAYGQLPVVGPDGTRPIDQYGRPWSGARGTRIAIIVGGLGLSQTGTQRAIRTLPEEITLAFAVSGNSLQRWMQEARRNGHEVLLQLPMEPFDYPANDPGPLTMLADAPADQNIDRLYQSLAKITNYSGVMNYLGGRFLADADALEPVMRDLAGRGLLFLDDGTSGQSLSATFARTFNMPHAFADVELDAQLDRAAILAKLDELERIALRKGSAIGYGAGFDATVAAIDEWAEEAGRRGIEIVGVSALADIPAPSAE